MVRPAGIRRRARQTRCWNSVPPVSTGIESTAASAPLRYARILALSPNGLTARRSGAPAKRRATARDRRARPNSSAQSRPPRAAIAMRPSGLEISSSRTAVTAGADAARDVGTIVRPRDGCGRENARTFRPGRLNYPGSDLLSHAVTSAVPSALEGLTSVFGMGTGVAPPATPPGIGWQSNTLILECSQATSSSVGVV